jgi:Zn-dependent protease/CBS domain-containing protein
MTGSFRVARVAGIDINLHATFGLVVLWGAWQWGDLGARGMLFGAVLMLLVFASVTLHELGHSLVARAFGIPVRDITLTPLGGVAQLGARPKTPGQEFLIALAGPAVNVVLAAVLGALAVGLYGTGPLRAAYSAAWHEQPGLETLWAMLIVSNVGLAAFNLVPALPMDGGRVLRAVLAWVVGLDTATRWAARLGRVLAVGFVVLGLYGQNPTLVLVGVFVYVAAGLEERAVRQDRLFDGILARDVVDPRAPRFGPDTTLGEAMGALVATPYSAFGVEHFGRLLGVLTRDQLLRAANGEGAFGYVAGSMQRQVPTIPAGAPLEAARLAMSEANSPFVAVVDQGLFLGLITEADLARQAALLDALGPVGASRGHRRATSH